MNELQTKYKALILLLLVVALSPIFFAASNNDRLVQFMETTYVVQEAAEHYSIDINECIKCQEGGWEFAAILIVFLVVVIIASFAAILVPLAVILKIFAGWSFSFAIQTLLLGRYPEQWKVKNT